MFWSTTGLSPLCSRDVDCRQQLLQVHAQSWLMVFIFWDHFPNLLNSFIPFRNTYSSKLSALGVLCDNSLRRKATSRKASERLFHFSRILTHVRQTPWGREGYSIPARKSLKALRTHLVLTCLVSRRGCLEASAIDKYGQGARIWQPSHTMLKSENCTQQVKVYRAAGPLVPAVAVHRNSRCICTAVAMQITDCSWVVRKSSLSITPPLPPQHTATLISIHSLSCSPFTLLCLFTYSYVSPTRS